MDEKDQLGLVELGCGGSGGGAAGLGEWDRVGLEGGWETGILGIQEEDKGRAERG